MRLLRASVLFVSGLVLALPALAQSGQLNTTNVSIENAGLLIRFQYDAALNAVDVDIVDKSLNHRVQHRSSHVWTLDLFKPSAPLGAHAQVQPQACDNTISFVKTADATGQRVQLVWTNCTVAAIAPDVVTSVTLNADLPTASKTAQCTLSAQSGQQTWAFYSGSIDLSLVPDVGLHYDLLHPFGWKTHDPAANLPATTYSFQGRPLTQVAALYDELGRGLYFGARDTTGDFFKDFRCSSAGAGQPARCNLSWLHWSEDVMTPANAFQFAYPVAVGRFIGGWFDAALQYRDWVETAAIASSGLLETRPDVPAWAKRAQTVGLLATVQHGPYAPISPPNPETNETVSDRLFAYTQGKADQPGQATDDLLYAYTVQFGRAWMADNCMGLGVYHATTQGAANAIAMQAHGLLFGLYLQDNQYASGAYTAQVYQCSTTPGPFAPSVPPPSSFATENWAQVAVTKIDGTLFQRCWGCDLWGGDIGVGCGGGATFETYDIDPYTSKWQQRMETVAASLASTTGPNALGIDGFYVDNFFPAEDLMCFSAAHGHSAGFGTHYSRGCAETFRRMIAAGAAVSPTGITAATEVTTEGYVRDSNQFLFVGPGADGVTNDTSTVVVPLGSVVYHHLVGFSSDLGVLYFNAFTTDQLVPNPPPACGATSIGPAHNTVWSTSAQERADGLDGGAYLLAFDWVNGAPIQTPETPYGNGGKSLSALPGFPAGTNLPWSFEPGAVSFPAEYLELCAMARRLAQIRGVGSAHRFLDVGRRVRDVTITSPSPMLTTDVPMSHLAWGHPSEGNVEETVPRLLQAVYQDPLGSDVAVALANHTAQPITPTLVFPTSSYGLNPALSYDVFSVRPGLVAGQTIDRYLFTFTGNAATWPLLRVDARDYLLLMVKPH